VYTDGFTIHGSLHFPLYINDLPQIAYENYRIVLFADDTSVIITNTDLLNLRENFNKMIQDTNDWFDAILFTFNLDKTLFLQFMTKNISFNEFTISHGNKNIAMVDDKYFLVLY
jgi:hypothetical protein